MNDKKRASDELRPTGRRVEAFSDAVFAIIVTIMMIEIKVPDILAFGSDRAALGEFAVILLTYALSFLVIANLWVSHHYLLFTIHNPSRTTIWFNNLLLFCVSLVPIATRFLGMYPSSPRATAAYGFVATIATAAFMLLRSHAARRTHNELHRDIHRRILRRTWVFVSIYAASVPLSFVDPRLAWACFIIVPPMLFAPIIRADVMRAAEERALERSCP